MTGQDTNQQLQALIDQSPLSIVDKETCYSVCRSIISSKDGVRPIEALDLLLNSISLSHEPSYVPLACLSFILRSTSDSWPVFDLIQCHSRLWRALPENVKSGNDPKSSTMVAESLKQVKASYQSLLQLLHPDCDKPAISDPRHHKSLSHRALSKYINDFRIPVPIYTDPKPIIVVALPIGSLLALACMAVATYYTAAPINPTSGAEEFQNDPLLLLQLVPLVLLYPMKQALRWTSFLYILAYLTLLWPSPTLIIERYITLLASMFLSKVVLGICSPFIGIIFKWVVIGRFKEGLYPMWGPYHTRWWFVEKSLKIWDEVSNSLPRLNNCSSS